MHQGVELAAATHIAGNSACARTAALSGQADERLEMVKSDILQATSPIKASCSVDDLNQHDAVTTHHAGSAAQGNPSAIPAHASPAQDDLDTERAVEPVSGVKHTDAAAAESGDQQAPQQPGTQIVPQPPTVPETQQDNQDAEKIVKGPATTAKDLAPPRDGDALQLGTPTAASLPTDPTGMPAVKNATNTQDQSQHLPPLREPSADQDVVLSLMPPESQSPRQGSAPHVSTQTPVAESFSFGTPGLDPAAPTQQPVSSDAAATLQLSILPDLQATNTQEQPTQPKSAVARRCLVSFGLLDDKSELSAPCKVALTINATDSSGAAADPTPTGGITLTPDTEQQDAKALQGVKMPDASLAEGNLDAQLLARSSGKAAASCVSLAAAREFAHKNVPAQISGVHNINPTAQVADAKVADTVGKSAPKSQHAAASLPAAAPRMAVCKQSMGHTSNNPSATVCNEEKSFNAVLLSTAAPPRRRSASNTLFKPAAQTAAGSPAASSLLKPKSTLAAANDVPRAKTGSSTFFRQAAASAPPLQPSASKPLSKAKITDKVLPSTQLGRPVISGAEDAKRHIGTAEGRMALPPAADAACGDTAAGDHNECLLKDAEAAAVEAKQGNGTLADSSAKAPSHLASAAGGSPRQEAAVLDGLKLRSKSSAPAAPVFTQPAARPPPLDAASKRHAADMAPAERPAKMAKPSTTTTPERGEVASCDWAA